MSGSRLAAQSLNTTETLRVWIRNRNTESSLKSNGGGGNSAIEASSIKQNFNLQTSLSVQGGGGMADLAKLFGNLNQPAVKPSLTANNGAGNKALSDLTVLAPALKPFIKSSNIQNQAAAQAIEKSQNTTSEDELEGADPRLKVLIRIFEYITGKKFDFVNFNKIKEKFEKKSQSSADTTPQAQPQTPPAQKNTDAQQNAQSGVGIEYSSRTVEYEYEKTNFSVAGSVVTSDGKEIKFKLDLEMTREFMQETEVGFAAGDAVQKDPLVINYDGSSAELSDFGFDFDLDSDGEPDTINFPKLGSGFLSFDRNNDGIINNGSELFGAKTGNGFAELAQLDNDNNGWLDEADPVFNDLKLWTKNAAGSDSLYSLQQKSIGAIYLKNQSTP
ncbi:MAG: hypothetical protein QG635_1013, partial [Bacteroidota bacterium]|nr:hypothetical protein [Bacteroidota bacterium]